MAIAALLLYCVFFFLASLISLGVALYRGRPEAGGIRKPAAFGFFICGVVMLLVNILFFALVWLVLDLDKGNLESLDIAVVVFWSWLQVVIWVAAAIVFNKVRK